MTEDNSRLRYAIPVDWCALYRYAIVRSRKHFSVRMHRDQRWKASLDGLLEIRPETWNRLGPARSWMRACVPELCAKAAKVVTLAPVPMIETRHVDMLAPDTVIVECFCADKFRR